MYSCQDGSCLWCSKQSETSTTGQGSHQLYGAAPARECIELPDLPEVPATRPLLRGWLPQLLVLQHRLLWQKMGLEQQRPPKAGLEELSGQENEGAWDHSA